MLNTITAVQECDATEVQSGKLSWEQKSLAYQHICKLAHYPRSISVLSPIFSVLDSPRMPVSLPMSE
jgi:hypothetical protein